MKRFLILFVFLVLRQYANSQDNNTVYYNSDWEVTSIASGKYYRIAGFDLNKMTFDGPVSDYYIDGSLEMTGKYSNGLKEGEFIYYSPDKSVRLKTCYKNDKRSSIWTEYFENGKVHKEVSYENGKERLMQYYKKNGKSRLKNGNGKFLMYFYSTPFVDPDLPLDTKSKPTKQRLEGKIKNGYKNGTWALYEYHMIFHLSDGEWIPEEKLRLISTFKYKDGEFLCGTYFAISGDKKDITKGTFTGFIPEPVKIERTELLLFEPGQYIKYNNLFKTVQNLLEK